MKQILLSILAICCSQLLVGQTWQPLYPGETYIFSVASSPDETIGIYGEQSPFSSEFLLTLYADDECAGADCENCYQLVPTFLQSEITFLPEGVVSFQNPDTLFIYTLSALGDSWTFGTDGEENEITATITELSEIEIFGQMDSLKTMMLSDGREIQLSKAHGVYRWITADDTLTLTSIPQREPDEIYLTKNEVYDFNIGDIFCYRTEDLDYVTPQFTGVETYSTSTKISRYEVINIVDSADSRQIEFATTKYYDFYLYVIPPGDFAAGVGHVQDTITVTIDLNIPDLIFTLPDQGFYYRGSIPTENEAYWLAGNTGYYTSYESQGPDRSLKLDHSEINGRNSSAFGIKDFHFAFNADTPVEEIMDASPFAQFNLAYGVSCAGNGPVPFTPANPMTDIDEYGFEDFGSTFITNDILAYAEGLGNLAFLGKYTGIGFYGHSNSILIGYQKGEETDGFVPSELELISLNVTEASKSELFSVYPNPANDAFQITTLETGPSDLRIFDISGREIYSRKIAVNNAEIQTGNYPSGIYFIRLNTPNGAAVQKVIISH